MKNILFFLAVTLFSVTACQDSKTKPDTKWLETQTEINFKMADEAKVDTVIVSPNAIGVSDGKLTFTPYPTCRGGECCDYEFSIGIKLTAESSTINIYYTAGGFVGEKGKAKLQPDIEVAKQVQKILGTIKPEEVELTMINNLVYKISKKELFQGNQYVPAKTLWERK